MVPKSLHKKIIEDHQTSIHQTATVVATQTFFDFHPWGNDPMWRSHIFCQIFVGEKTTKPPIQWLTVSSWLSVCNPVVSLATVGGFTPNFGEDEPKLTSIFFQYGLVETTNFGTGSQAEKLNYLRDASKACEEAGPRSFDVSTGGVFFVKKILNGTNQRSRDVFLGARFSLQEFKKDVYNYYIFSW